MEINNIFTKIDKIYYFHILNDDIINKIHCYKNNNSLIIADDAHISIKNHLDIIDYVSVIGRCSCVKSFKNKQEKNTPNINTNLQSALYNSLLGYNNGFMNIYDLPKNKILNHTFSHNKVKLNDNVIDKFDKTNCKNWWAYNNNIYESIPIHMLNKHCAEFEIKSMFKYISNENKRIVVAPWNQINDIFINVCKLNNIDYIIYSDIYDVNNNMVLNIPRINLEKI